MSDLLLSRPLLVLSYPGAESTWITGANAAGQLTGYYIALGGRYGFVYSPFDLSWTPIAIPGTFDTRPTGINAQGDVVGDFDDAGTRRGFLIHNGAMQPIFPPDAFTADSLHINAAGQVAGTWADEDGNTRAFLYDNGLYQAMEPPGGGNSRAVAISDSGAVLVSNVAPGGGFQAWLWQGGAFTGLSCPGALGTVPTGMNAAGQVAGYIIKPDGHHAAFLWQSGGFTTFEGPNATNTEAAGITADGRLYGTWQQAVPDSPLMGFVQGPDGLTSVLVDLPGTTSSHGGQFSAITGVLPNGVVIGQYTTFAPGTDAQSTVTFIGATTESGGTVLSSGATYDLTPGLLEFGDLRAGGIASQGLRLANLSVAGSNHALGATLDLSAGLAGGGTITGLLPLGVDDTSLRVGIDTTAAGIHTGTATVTLIDAGVAGGTATVTASGTVHNPAALSLPSATLDLGLLHPGLVHAALPVGNAAPAGAFSESLSLALTGTGLAGQLDHLAPAADGMLEFDLALAANGSFAIPATLAATSDGAGTLAPLDLGTTPILLTGTVQNYATAALGLLAGPGTLAGAGTAWVLDLGTLALGGPAIAATLGLANAAPGLADLLAASLDFTAAPHFANPEDAGLAAIAAGATASLGAIGFTPAALGLFTDTITIAQASRLGTDDTPLAPITVTLRALVAAGDAADHIDGTLASEVLAGAGGADRIAGYPAGGGAATPAGDDTLLGGAGRDTLLGGAGNDSLDGGGAGDLMAGGDGDDTYVVNVGADSIAESPGAGTDTVIALRGFLALPDNVEALVLADPAGQTGWGNAADNLVTGSAGPDSIRAGAGNDTVSGGAGADSILGGAGADLLLGAEGDDTLEGGPGADTLAGGAGNDTYGIDSPADLVQEDPGGGDDTVVSTLRFTALPAGVENLFLAPGAGPATLWGNAADNRLVGGTGADTLRGGQGNDTLDGGPAGTDRLHGGTGADTFVIGTDSTDTVWVDDFTPWETDVMLLDGFGPVPTIAPEGIGAFRVTAAGGFSRVVNFLEGYTPDPVQGWHST
jgi:probable HAF family extracellular repeat protein